MALCPVMSLREVTLALSLVPGPAVEGVTGYRSHERPQRHERVVVLFHGRLRKIK
jgi:hypothetical protein